MSKQRNNTVSFNFDVSAYRLLGRELITDRITALFELVKNSYDANATNVCVEFVNVNPVSSKSKIIISDDGIGMTLSDIEKRWMVIGTSSKRRDRLSPSPCNRRVSGKKGVGRFAVDKLGDKLTLKTKKRGDKKRIILETDWSLYSELENEQLSLPLEVDKLFFTDVENKFWYEEESTSSQGTTLEIGLVNETWTENDIKRAFRELSKLVSPNILNQKSTCPFNIVIKSQYDAFKEIAVETNLVDFATQKVHLKYDRKSKTQEILKYEQGELKTVNVPYRPCGPLEIILYYFNQEDKKKYKNHFNTDIDGVKVYRDGIITTPFAEYVADQTKQKDILGLDKRRYSGFFEKFGTRDLLGFIEITDVDNPNIIESTNRQGFVDNEAWEELKSLLIEQIAQLEEYYKNLKEQERVTAKINLGGAKKDLSSLKKEIATIKKEASPEVKKKLRNIEANIGKIQGSVSKSMKEYARLEKETKQKENLFFSLVTLQTYAAMFSHMTKHTIGHIITSAEYFKNNYPNPDLEDRFLKIAKNIYDEMLKLRKGVDFMLKYAKSDSEIEEINLKELIEHVFSLYEDKFKEDEIQIEIEINKGLILNYNRKALEDIFDNLITNSLKALKGQKDKIIKCSSLTTTEDVTVIFSDNGYGIKEKDKFRVFDVFHTTTAEEGGAGMGLYVVKTRIEAMQGEIWVAEPEFYPRGATLMMKLPFKK